MKLTVLPTDGNKPAIVAFDIPNELHLSGIEDLVAQFYANHTDQDVVVHASRGNGLGDQVAYAWPKAARQTERTT